MTDADGITEERSESVSVFNGPPLGIVKSNDEASEVQSVAEWLIERGDEMIQNMRKTFVAF